MSCDYNSARLALPFIPKHLRSFKRFSGRAWANQSE